MMLTIGRLIVYLAIGLFIAIVSYLKGDMDDEFYLALAFIAWPLVILGAAIMALGYGIGFVLKWIGKKIKGSQK
jgi:hypothetical protein